MKTTQRNNLPRGFLNSPFHWEQENGIIGIYGSISQLFHYSGIICVITNSFIATKYDLFSRVSLGLKESQDQILTIWIIVSVIG